MGNQAKQEVGQPNDEIAEFTFCCVGFGAMPSAQML